MKKALLFSAISFLFLTANAQVDSSANDWQLIQRTINLYIDGQANGDSAMIAQSFHDTWQLKVYRDNVMNVVPKSEYGKGLKKRVKPNTWTARTVFIDVSNDIAIAKVEISTSKLLFTDYFHILKTNQGWLIVDKISTRVPHKTVEVPAPAPKS